jgi:hypothetical protein
MMCDDIQLAIQDARAYIKEMELRETDLVTSNASLRTQLTEKQTELDDQQKEFKALETDLQQSQNAIEFYQNLAKYHETIAERAERKLTEACRAQKNAADDADKIQNLERAVAERDIVISKLIQQNCTIIETHETEHEENLALLASKDTAILTLTNRVNQVEAEKMLVDADSSQVADTCNSLIDTIEQESATAAEALNSKSIRLFELRDSNDQFCAAVASELKPLSRLYEHIEGVVKIYGDIFKGLADMRTGAVPHMPQELDGVLDAANDALYAYQKVADGIHAQRLANKYDVGQEKVVRQVDGIAKAAARTCTSVEEFRDNVDGMLKHLRISSDTWLAISSQADSRHSSRSSISSLMSFTKRFSTSSRPAMSS